MIKTVVGDLLDATEDIIVQQVNCRSVMGSGVAKAIYTRWPEVKTEYHKFCRRSTSPYDLLGKVQLIDVEPGKAVANVFGQLNYGRTAKKTKTKEIKCGINYGWMSSNRLDWAMRQIAEYLQRERDELEELRQIDKFCGLSKGA